MSCDCNCKKSSVNVTALKAGTWLQKGKEDVHFYSTSLCEGGVGSTLGFNGEEVGAGRGQGTTIALFTSEKGTFLQTVDNENVLRHYKLDADFVYNLLYNTLLVLKGSVSEQKPILVSHPKS